MTREEAIKRLSDIRANYSCFDDDERPKYHALSMAIEALQTDIVRCKDCRHAEHRKQMQNQVYCKRDKLSPFGAVHDDDDFCKYGERREP